MKFEISLKSTDCDILSIKIKMLIPCFQDKDATNKGDINFNVKDITKLTQQRICKLYNKSERRMKYI